MLHKDLRESKKKSVTQELGQRCQQVEEKVPSKEESSRWAKTTRVLNSPQFMGYCGGWNKLRSQETAIMRDGEIRSAIASFPGKTVWKTSGKEAKERVKEREKGNRMYSVFFLRFL